MPIPESQFETWSRQGSVAQSSATYKTVADALRSPKALYREKEYEVFLQGSYGNDTNIYAESDVDVVIRLDSIMRSDLSELPSDQKEAYHRTYSNATYTHQEFRRGVETRLRTAFGDDAEPGNKAIQIKASGSRRKADVVVCHQYRRYSHFRTGNDCAYVQGIIFPSLTSGEVINYPKVHSANLTAKHKNTSSWFKPMARIFKNIRSRMVDESIIAEGCAPSYYIEGLLYNVPSDRFGTTFKDSFIECVNWLHGANRGKWLCAHEQCALLGEANVQWKPDDCDQFLDGLVELWEDW